MAAEVEAFDEAGHPHYFDRDVWDALTRLGLTAIVAGRPTFDTKEIDLLKFPQLAVCDFCHDRPVTWNVDCATFDTSLVDYTSIDGWAACEPCGQAILERDQRTLQRRVLAFCRQQTDTLEQRFATRRNWTRRSAAQLELLALFWQHYRSIQRYK
jgi:hypothetical protein